MPRRQGPKPLLFIVQDVESFTPSRTSAEASAISSHVSSRYRGWRKHSHRNLSLHHTTAAILTSSQLKRKRLTYSHISPSHDDDDGEDFFGQYRDQLTKSSMQWVYAPFDAHLLPGRKVKLRPSKDLLAPQFSRIGSQTLDPFAPDYFKNDLELQANLFFYTKIIRPFAVHLIEGWSWIECLSQVQASPVLAYAVAAYASVFLSGSLRGGPGVVLPPPTERGQPPLWQIPPWLRLQTSCVAELNTILSDPTRVDDSCFQAIVFLLRLSILLADGESGRMHLSALQRLSAILGRENIDIDKEMAVDKINIVSAFLHNPSVVLVKTRTHKRTGRIRQSVKLHRRLWICDREWYTFCAAVNGRTLTWRAGSPSGQLLAGTAHAIARMDPASQQLSDEQLLKIQRCYQIALYLSVYLNNISFNTGATCVLVNALDLEARLSALDMSTVTRLCPCTVFNLLMVGAMATRGFAERRIWFLRHLSTHYAHVRRIDHVYRMIAAFIDPLHIIYNAVEDTWDDVLRFRATVSKGRAVTSPAPVHQMKGDQVYEIENLRPMSYSPDLKKPVDVIEVEDVDLDLKQGFI